MTDRTNIHELSARDRLLTRPDEPLPTKADPRAPHGHRHNADPKLQPVGGQGTDPDAGNIGHAV